MTNVTAYGELLAAQTGDRTLTYRLLPFGEPGRTSAGTVTASAHTIELPAEPGMVHLNLEHERTRPVGKAVSLVEDDDGITASFRIAQTSAGDDLLVEAAEGLRTGVSVELADIVIRNGAIVRGRLTGAGAVVAPAFPSAQLAAADVGELDDDEQDDDEQDQQTPEPTDAPAPDAPDDPETESAGADDDDQEDTMTDTTVTASAPADITTGRPGQRERGPSAHDVAQLLAAYHATQDQGALRAIQELGHTQLFAALNDVKYDSSGAAGVNITQPGWLGQLWSGRQYRRRYMPLFGAVKPLTSLEVKGWKWNVKPGGDTWSGNKSAVPSNSPSTTGYTKRANKWAGGHDIAREFVDFPNPEFWESYVSAMNEDYAKDSDEGFLGEIVAAATPVTVGTVPSGAPEGLVKIVDGALHVLDYGAPAFAIMGKALWRDFILTPKDETLEFLSTSLGLEDGQVANFRVLPATTDDISDTQVLVGAAEAAEARELPGETPLRVEALNLVNGGVDNAFFGYWTSIIHEAQALALVDDPAAG